MLGKKGSNFWPKRTQKAFERWKFWAEGGFIKFVGDFLSNVCKIVSRVVENNTKSDKVFFNYLTLKIIALIKMKMKLSAMRWRKKLT